jgi:hypothetical protein
VPVYLFVYLSIPSIYLSGRSVAGAGKSKLLSCLRPSLSTAAHRWCERPAIPTRTAPRRVRLLPKPLVWNTANLFFLSFSTHARCSSSERISPFNSIQRPLFCLFRLSLYQCPPLLRLHPLQRSPSLVVRTGQSWRFGWLTRSR